LRDNHVYMYALNAWVLGMAGCKIRVPRVQKNIH
jgi:hypothetical protein